MLLIPCPNCGERDEREFYYGGRAIRYPDLDDSTSTWHRVIHQSAQPTAQIRETWYHQSGCECWFEITRNAATHEIES